MTTFVPVTCCCAVCTAAPQAREGNVVQRKHLVRLAVVVVVMSSLAALLYPRRATTPAASPSRPPAWAGSPFDAPSPQASAGAADPAHIATSGAPPADAAAAPPPYGLSMEQWRQLQAALADHPQRDAEMARIGSYLAYMQKVRRLRELRPPGGGAPSEELLALARAVETELPQHLARGEITAGEAMQLRVATLEVLQPDAAARQVALAAWKQSLAQVAAQNRQPDPREALFQQRQAALVAAWSAQPPQQRDPRVLEERLEALRQEVFTPAR
jgi:hypothetical protein